MLHLKSLKLITIVIAFQLITLSAFAQHAVVDMQFRNNKELYTYDSEFYKQQDTLYGTLHDNGLSNYFETAEYRDGEFYFARLRLHRRIFEVKDACQYVYFVEELSGSEIFSRKYKTLEGFDEEVDEAIKIAVKQQKKLISKTDLNKYKQAELFEQRAIYYPEIKHLDINKIELDKVAKVVCIDFNKQIFLIHTYNKTLSYAKEHHGEFLSFYTIYNNKDKEIIHFFVTITGFFLE